MRKRLVKLEQEAMSGVGIGQEHRIWKVLREPIGVGDRNHLVMDTVHDESRLANEREGGHRRSAEMSAGLPCRLPMRDAETRRFAEGRRYFAAAPAACSIRR